MLSPPFPRGGRSAQRPAAGERLVSVQRAVGHVCLHLLLQCFNSAFQPAGGPASTPPNPPPLSRLQPAAPAMRLLVYIVLALVGAATGSAGGKGVLAVPTPAPAERGRLRSRRYMHGFDHLSGFMACGTAVLGHQGHDFVCCLLERQYSSSTCIKMQLLDSGPPLPLAPRSGGGGAIHRCTRRPDTRGDAAVCAVNA